MGVYIFICVDTRSELNLISASGGASFFGVRKSMSKSDFAMVFCEK